MPNVQSPPVSDLIPSKQQHLTHTNPTSLLLANPISIPNNNSANSNSNGNHNSLSPSTRPSSPSNRQSTAEPPDPTPPLKSKNTGKEPESHTQSSNNEKSKEKLSTAALHLEQYVARDLLHASNLALQQEQSNNIIRGLRREIEYCHLVRRERARDPGAIYGYGYAGFGNGITDGNVRVLYPCQRKRPGGRKARELRLTRSQLHEQADQTEMLVPIRLDVDFDRFKLRDTFTWNLHERTVSMDLFAEGMVEDFHLPLNPSLIQKVTNSIREQVTDYHPHVFLADEPLDPTLPYTAYKNDDMRVLIKLNITIGQYKLVDRFEWDINNPHNSPEEFAQLLARDLSLCGEFTTAIAHSIREQCQLFTKALFVTNHPFDGRPVEDEDVRSAMLSSPISSVFRPHSHAKDYTPFLYHLSESDLGRVEESNLRETRRTRRLSRRRGPTMPDVKDMPKTHRTQIVSAILPGAVQKVTDLQRSMVVKQIKDGDSEEEDSDSEAEDLPPERTIPGYNNMTARQRHLAAAAAKASTQARSQTPEVHNTTSTRGERYAERARNDTPQRTPNQPTFLSLPRRPGVPLHQVSALVKVKISAAKLEKWEADQKQRDLKEQQKQELQQRKLQEQQKQEQQAMPPPQPPQTSQKTPKNQPPAIQVPLSPAPASLPQMAHPLSGNSGSRGPDAGEAPQPPEWLTNALATLRQSYPADRFEAAMRYLAHDIETNKVVQQSQVQNSGREVRWEWIPRIRCHDCPGKLYTPGPEQTVESFLVHVKNRGHRERVDQRVEKGRNSASGASSST